MHHWPGIASITKLPPIFTTLSFWISLLAVVRVQPSAPIECVRVHISGSRFVGFCCQLRTRGPRLASESAENGPVVELGSATPGRKLHIIRSEWESHRKHLSNKKCCVLTLNTCRITSALKYFPRFTVFVYFEVVYLTPYNFFSIFWMYCYFSRLTSYYKPTKLAQSHVSFCCFPYINNADRVLSHTSVDYCTVAAHPTAAGERLKIPHHSLFLNIWFSEVSLREPLSGK